MRFSTLTAIIAGLFMSSALSAGFSLEEWQARVTAENSIDQLGRLYIEFILEEDPSQSATLGVTWQGRRPQLLRQPFAGCLG